MIILLLTYFDCTHFAFSSVLVVLLPCSAVHGHRASVIRLDALGLQILYDFGSDVRKNLIYIGACFRTRLEKTQAMLIGQSLPPLRIDLLLTVHIRLVRYQNFLHIGQRMLVYLLKPVLNIVERRLLRAVVH